MAFMQKSESFNAKIKSVLSLLRLVKWIFDILIFHDKTESFFIKIYYNEASVIPTDLFLLIKLRIYVNIMKTACRIWCLTWMPLI